MMVTLIFLYFVQDQLIYRNGFFSSYEAYPGDNEEGMRDPSEKKMSYEDVSVETEDDIRLHGWFIHQGAKTAVVPTLVYMHGNAGNIGNKLAWAENIYFNLGVNIVLVGYRGYGHSEGSPSEIGLQKDSKAIIKWTLENPKINSNQVYLFGDVLGGAVAIYGAQSYQDRLKGIILQNAFLNMDHAVDDTNWVFRLLTPLILANYWPNDDRIKDIRLPILFISGTDSPTHDDMQKLRDLAVKSQYVQFLSVPNGKKKNTWRVGGKSYLLAIDEFITKTRALPNTPLPVSVETSSST
jgi:abhydrolase domain-containing protein 13